MSKKNDNINLRRLVSNYFYALKLSYKLSHKLAVNTVVETAVGYLQWVFYSAFFVRYVIGAIVNKESFGHIMVFVLAVGAIGLLLNGYSQYCSSVLFPIEQVKVFQGLYDKIYKKAENVDLSCYEDTHFYNKYTLALDDACNKITQSVDYFSSFTFGTIAGIISFITMIYIDKITIVFVLAPLIGNFVFAPLLSRISYRRYEETTEQKRRTDYINRIMYLPEYSKEIRLSNIYNLLKKQLKTAFDKQSKLAGKYFGKTFALGWLQYVFSYVIIFEGVLMYGAYRSMVSHTISFADMTVLTSIMVTASWVWVGVIDSFSNCTRNAVYVENLRTFMEYEEKIPEDYDGIMPEREIHSIEFRNVSFGYNNKEMIIKNISFKIKGKESVALVGHNGAGKTTILKLLFRLYDPTEGEILVNGHNIKEYNLRAYRELFSTAFQDYKLLGSSVRYNVLMGRKIDNADEVVVNALKDAGIYEKIMSLQQGIDTILTKEFDDKGALLSGGEYQKLAVARSFANRAPIMVFDEPSSALDPIAEYELFGNIVKVSKDATTIYISHRLSSVRKADIVFLLENGQIKERGSHDELIAMDGIYADMYHKQEKNYFASDDIMSEGENVLRV